VRPRVDSVYYRQCPTPAPRPRIQRALCLFQSNVYALDGRRPDVLSRNLRTAFIAIRLVRIAETPLDLPNGSFFVVAYMQPSYPTRAVLSVSGYDPGGGEADRRGLSGNFRVDPDDPGAGLSAAGGRLASASRLSLQGRLPHLEQVRRRTDRLLAEPSRATWSGNSCGRGSSASS